MKKHLSVAAVFLLAAALALAHAPSVSINPIGPLEFATFPQVVTVTGTVTHEQNVAGPNDNLCATNAMKVIVTDSLNQNVTILDQGNPGNYFNWSCSDSVGAWSAPWNITAPGTYTITTNLKHQNAIGEDVELVIVTQIVVEQCPAAPAIAAEYLKSEGVKSGSKTWKSVMTAVAGQTGSNGSLWAANACDVGYADDVKAFVDTLLA